MNIHNKTRWNKVTWCSKFLSIVFFIAILPIWTFYLGTRYQSVIETINTISFPIYSPIHLKFFKKQVLTQDQPSDISGVYGFEEYASPNEDESYTLTIAKVASIVGGGANGGGYSVNLSIDGFQTETRLIGHTVQSDSQFGVIFDSYGKDNIGEQYHSGDTLFNLEIMGSGKLKIDWIKERPLLANTDVGSSFFVK
jgi:hypothetical protein